MFTSLVHLFVPTSKIFSINFLSVIYTQGCIWVFGFVLYWRACSVVEEIYLFSINKTLVSFRCERLQLTVRASILISVALYASFDVFDTKIIFATISSPCQESGFTITAGVSSAILSCQNWNF